MKKLQFIGLILLLTITTFSFIKCSDNEKVEESEVNLSPIPESKLKNLRLESKNINEFFKQKNLIQLEENRGDLEIGGDPDYDPNCPSEKIENKELQLFQNRIVNEDKSFISLFNDESRLFRDEILLTGETGNIYKDSYYYLGKSLSLKEISLSDIQNFIEIIPTAKKIYDRIKNNDGSIVIGNLEKESIIKYISSIENKIIDNDTNKALIIEAVKDDINSLTNRNSTQILEFISK